MVTSAVFNLSRLRAKVSIALILLISSATAVAGTFTVHGPQVFVRAGGQPVTEVVNFNVMDPTAEYTIIVTNGANGGKKVSSGEVLVNGIQILGPSDFGQNVTQVIRPVTLLGANSLSVELRGKPGGAIAVEIIGIDDVAPTITAAAQPSPNGAGWNNGTVIVSFDCSDDTSGIQSCPDPIVVGVDGANQVISGTATDRAGNTETASVTLNIDTTQPAIDFSLTPVANAQGWHNADTTVSFVCTDAVSGIFSCTDPVSIVAEGANQEVTGTAIDVADNTATAVATVSLDKTNPTISASAEPPANANGWNNSDVTVNFACNDALSGVDSCTAPVLVTTEGADQGINGSGADIAGNSVTTSVSISIDRTAPSLTIVSPVAGSTISSTVPSISVTYSDNLLIDITSLAFTANGSPLPVTCQNGSGSSDCTPSTDLPEGAITLAASILDDAGNNANAEVSFEIVIDADGDGVPDALDQCPDTPSGETVDANGCSPSQLDADGDGVSDALDQCPGTPTGEAVDANGCSASQLDADADGVPNTIDQCPNTPAGEAVDANGCSPSQLDEDGDGVSDAVDQCPATPAGEVVDANGCSPSQLDEDGDGVSDALDQCAGTPAGEAVDANGCSPSQLDADGDGVPDATDQCPDTPAGEAVDADGCSASQQDTQPPTLNITSPSDGALVTVARPKINLTYSDASDIDEDSLAIQLNGSRISAVCINDQTRGECTLAVDLPDGTVTLSASIADAVGNIAQTQIQVLVDSGPVNVDITSPSNGFITSAGSIEVTGLSETDISSVRVNDVVATVINGSFAVTVPLREGTNMLVVVATNSNGKTGVRSVDVTRDIIAPIVRIDSPRDGFNSIDNRIAITGLVNDIVSGGVDTRVTVNGIEATVSDGTFMLVDLLLTPGPNVIEAVATDAVGNQGQDSITVNFESVVGKRITVLSGNGQAEIIRQLLPQPLVVEVTDDLGNPVAGSVVNFEVTRNSGLIKAAAGDIGRRILQVPTNGSGQASVLFELGDTSGEGNNRIIATSLGVAGEAEFCASALASAATDIQMISGDNQRGIVGEPLAQPLEALVIDADGNPIKSLPVTFSVTRGGGLLDGQDTISKITGTDGIARAILTLGPDAGINNNVVQATFTGATTLSAAYLASGMAQGNPANTRFSGVVLDNSQTPIPGAVVSIVDSSSSAVTDAEGQFLLVDVPVGSVHLHIDPSGSPRPETFPPLEFETVTVAGQVNILGQPIMLPAVQLQNSKIVGGAEDVTIFMPDVDGMSLTVKAGSATFPNGDSTGQLSISQVQLDKVPMAPPNGSLFMPPAWTIQPAGVTFDPPAQITIPNDGLPPGRIIDIFQFDHALNQFANVGKGIVSDDGFNIVSDNGFGITRTGWGGCGLPPPDDECDQKCNAPTPEECQKVESGPCPSCPVLVPADPSKVLVRQDPNDCDTNTCGGKVPDDTETPEDDCKVCLGGDEVIELGNDGNTCKDGCGTCVDGSCAIDEDKPLPPEQQSADDCVTLFCGKAPELVESEAPPNDDIHDCKQPICTLSGPDFVAAEFESPEDVEGDCKQFFCNGVNKDFVTDTGDAPDVLPADIPGDCRMPGCNAGGSPAADGLPNPFDEPTDGDTVCLGCIGGSIDRKTTGRIEGTCQECNNGFLRTITEPVTIDQCTFCSNGTLNTREGPLTECTRCDNGTFTRLTGPIAGESCRVCQDGNVRVLDTTECVDEEDPEGKIVIPIMVRHIISTDHVGVPLTPAPPPFFDARLVPAAIGLDCDPNSDLTLLNSSIGTTLSIGHVIFTGDNQAGWKPSEHNPGPNTYRVRSLVILEYDIADQTFEIASNIDDYRQPGFGNVYERGTAVTPTLSTFWGGSGLFASYTDDPVPGPTRRGTGCFRDNTSIPHNDALGTYTDDLSVVCVTHDAFTSPANGFVPKKLCSGPAGFGNSSELPVLTQLADGKVSVFMEMENRLQQVFPRFDVEWEFTIEFDFTDENAPTYKITDGAHKLFPLYELYIGDQRIYGYDGVLAGNGGRSLVTLLGTPGFGHNISNRSADEPGVLENPPFEGVLNSESRVFNECLSRHPNSRPASCN